MNLNLLKEITSSCKKFLNTPEFKTKTTMFLLMHDSESDTISCTPVYGAMFEGDYPIRTGM